MFLATTALLLQFLALPASALPAVDKVIDSNASAAASGQTSVMHFSAAPDVSEPTSEKLVAAAKADPKVTYMPGRLVLEPAPAAPVEPASFTTAPAILDSAAVEKERRWEQRQKRIWMGLNIAQSGAATFDAWSTRRVISSGQGEELNPMLRPFVGNNSLYAVIQVAPLLLDYVGHRMMTSNHSWARHTWWIPQSVGTAASLAAGINNVGVLTAH